MSNNDRQRIGQRIAQIRTAKGMTQLQLAEAAGLAQSNIARIEAGRYSTGLDILAKIGDALGVTLDYVEE